MRQLLYIKLLKFVDTVLYIGANTEIYTLIAATDNPDRKVYAFEPVPRVFSHFKRNIELNKVDNLQINYIAISDYDCEITLYVPSVNIPKTSSTAKGFRENSEAISVQALSIDSFVNINNILKVALMKIDTETTEHLVLQGAKNVLQRDEPIIISGVLKGEKEELLHSILDNTEYKYFLISGEGLVEKEKIEGDETYINKNYLFITEKMQEIINLSSTDVEDSIFARTPN